MNATTRPTNIPRTNEAHSASSSLPLGPHPEPSPLSRHWSLDRGVVFLNHGSFGACPDAVLDAQQRYIREMEREAVRYFCRGMWPALDRVRASLASFCGGDPGDFVLVPNATHAVATVMHNAGEVLGIGRGDEILTCTHEYPACLNNLQQHADRLGAKVARARVPFPAASPDEAFDAIMGCVTDRTRLAMLSHVTSPTGLVLPIERLVPALRARGVETLVDGAHAPGMLDLDLGALDAFAYTANCHKWVCSPKGSAFLHVRRDRQAGFRPLALSNFANAPEFARPEPPRSFFNLEFDYAGTNDHAAWRAIVDAIDCVGRLVPGGWDEVRAHNHALVLEARSLVCGALKVEPGAPASMIGSIATVELPPHDAELDDRLAARPTHYADALQDALVETHGVQIPVWAIRDPETDRRRRTIRLSAQLYNTRAQFEYLARALVYELERERTL